MRKLHRIVLFAALVVSTSAALAQERGPRGFGRGAGGAPSGAMLLGQKSVQEDLKLSDEQIKQVDEFSAKQRESFSGLREASREDRVKAFAESREAGQKALDTILNDEQRARLKQIALQLAGPAAFNDPQVAEKLAFTDEQKKSIEEIQSSHRDEMRSLFQDSEGDRAESFRKMQTARQATEEKLHGLLTDEQKTRLQELTGKKFEGRLEGPSGRGPGRGRRGGQDASLRRAKPGERDTTVLTADKSNEGDADKGDADKQERKAKQDGDKAHKRGDKKKTHAKHAKHRQHGEHTARHHSRKSHARHASHGKRHHHGNCEKGYAHRGDGRGHGRPSGYAWHVRHRFDGPSHRAHFARRGHDERHRGHFGPPHHFAARHHVGRPHPFGHGFDARRQAWDRVARAMGDYRGHGRHHHHGDRRFAHRDHGRPGHHSPHHFAHGSWRGAGQKFHVWSDRGRHGEHHKHHDRRLSNFDAPRGPHFAWHFDRHREDGPGFEREYGASRPPQLHPAGHRKRPHDAAERDRLDREHEKHGAKRHGKVQRDHKSHEQKAHDRDQHDAAQKHAEKRDKKDDKNDD